MADGKRVLFVCTGNTCRSPMAEGLFRDAVSKRRDYFVSSAGVAAYPGQDANPETVALLKRRGISLGSFESRPVTRELIDDATHVFAMTHGHLRTLERLFPDSVEKFYLACEFADIPGKGVAADVPDPIGMGRKAYEEVAKVLDLAIPSIIAFIDQTWQSR
jgi:protein-tyrosine-phosphatase